MLDAPISLADLPHLSRQQLTHLAAEVRGRLILVQQELVACRGVSPSQGGDLAASVVPALADLEVFLSFFEHRVMRHRQRLPRMSGGTRPSASVPLLDVA